MPDSTAAARSPAAPVADPLLRAVLDVSLSAINLLRPLYAAGGGELIDFGLDYLNPAAQRLTGLAEQPGGSLKTQFPAAFATGVFAFYQRVFETGEPGHHDFPHQTDGSDGIVRVAARRHGEQLVASFTDAASPPRPAAEQALRASQAREQAAHAETEAQRQRLYAILEQFPAVVASYRGPQHVFELVSHRFQQDFPNRPIKGLPVREALPELRGQQYYEILDGVYRTGQPFYGTELETWVDRTATGALERQYYNVFFQVTRDAQGTIDGIINFAYDVTAAVLARQQVQQLNEELELRVTARSAEVRAALHEAERQREQARGQHALLGQILGQLPAAIATLTGPEHRYSFFNDAYQALAVGRGVLGRPVAEALPEVVEQGFIALLDQVYDTGQPFIGTEMLLVLLDPATGLAGQRYIDLRYQPLVDGQQRTQGILAFVLDVTDKVRARRQAETLQTTVMAVLQRQGQERENVYQLFEQAPAAICLLRAPEHRIHYLNPAYQALFPGRELGGRDFADVNPEADELVQLFDGVYRDGQTQFRGEVPVLVPQSGGQPPRPRYFDFTYQAYREQGQIVGVSIFGSDVTERVRTRRQRDEQRDAQQAELRRVFEQAPVPIAILRGPGFIVELANGAIQAVWGRPLAQVLGRPYFSALPETAGQGFEQIFAEVLRTGRRHSVTEAPVQLPHGTGHARQGYVNFAFQPLFDAQQRPTGLMAIGVEVTDQVRARQQVLALNEELQATNRALHDTNQRLTRTNADLDTFVYTASHDLKAPIANIEGLLTALRHDLPPAVMQDALVPRLLDLMQDSVVRFQQTIGHLTDISQLQQAEATETVDLAALVRGVQLDLAPLIEAAAATLTVRVGGCENVRVAPKTLRSVVYNLLSNAVKYRAPGRPAQVQLRAHCPPGQLVLEVQDNGLGLTVAQQGQLFGMFRRLHTHVEGSGVGLFMVKRLVENADGTITVRSQLDAGTTFTVTLPA